VSYPWITPAAKYGFPGAQLFFKISGFVIFMTASNANLKSFAISRIVRLYPTFCGMLHHYVHCNPVGRPTPRSGAAPVFILIVFICTDIHDTDNKKGLTLGWALPDRQAGRILSGSRDSQLADS
jgi:peptidoglycan/LPS O-acetylase OafA/YrhL